MSPGRCPLREELLARVASPEGFEILFEYLPDIYFFVKAADGRFMRVSGSFAKLVGADSAEDVIGARDADFFSADLAESYQRDDRQVLRSSESIIDKVELVRNSDGVVDWFCTTKLPLFDSRGFAIGVCGVTRDVKRMSTNNARFLSWAPVLEMIHEKYTEPLSTTLLAAKVALSVSQFNRQFRSKFKSTPRDYLTKVRMNAACQLLVTTSLSISAIALRTGYYDQSHFTNQFSRRHGIAPAQYRARHASHGEHP